MQWSVGRLSCLRVVVVEGVVLDGEGFEREGPHRDGKVCDVVVVEEEGVEAGEVSYSVGQSGEEVVVEGEDAELSAKATDEGGYLGDGVVRE